MTGFSEVKSFSKSASTQSDHKLFGPLSGCLTALDAFPQVHPNPCRYYSQSIASGLVGVLAQSKISILIQEE
jgi:hypothetical protein